MKGIDRTGVAKVLGTIGGLVLLNLLLYSASLRSYMLPQDDFHHVYEWTAQKVSHRTLFLADTYGRVGKAGHYRPLEVLSHVVDGLVWKDRVWGRHVTNVALHAGCAILVFLLVSLLSSDYRVALFSSLLFSAHPAHADAVCWISGRTDVIGTFFVLMSLYLYLLSARSNWIFYPLSLLAFAVALLSKEISFVVPLMILALELVWLRRLPAKAAVVRMAQVSGGGLGAPVFSLSAGLLVTSFLAVATVLAYGKVGRIAGATAVGALAGGIVVALGVSFLTLLSVRLLIGRGYERRVRDAYLYFAILGLYWVARSRIVGGVGGYYSNYTNWTNPSAELSLASFARDTFGMIGLLFPLPAGFNESVLTLHRYHPIVFYAVSIALLALAALVLYHLWRKEPIVGALLAFAFLSVLPVHNLLLRNTVYDPRYLYLSSVWICAFGGFLLASWLYGRGRGASRLFAMGTLVGTLAVYSAVTWKENRDYLYSGSVVRKFVDAIQEKRDMVCKAENVVVVTWPMLHWDTPRHVWISKYLDDIVTHTTSCTRLVDENVDFYFFVARPVEQVTALVVDDSTLLVRDCSDLSRFLVLPTRPSPQELELRKIYSRAWFDPHHRAIDLRSLPHGRTRELVGFEVETSGCEVRIRDPRLTLSHSVLVIYTRGRFEIVAGPKMARALAAS
ncbi:MAG: hypothetical protein ONB23_10025 [candidate division KSB1 bacterium]|nr:hypothetical protein [candidate division KSB1 bacterium]